MNRFFLELAAKLSSHHVCSPVSKTPYLGVLKSGSRPFIPRKRVEPCWIISVTQIKNRHCKSLSIFHSDDDNRIIPSIVTMSLEDASLR
jgi:hypothetical protein